MKILAVENGQTVAKDSTDSSVKGQIKQDLGLDKVENKTDAERVQSGAIKQALDSKVSIGANSKAFLVIGTLNPSSNQATKNDGSPMIVSSTPDTNLLDGDTLRILNSGTLSFSGRNFTSGQAVNVGDELTKFGNQWAVTLFAQNTSKTEIWTKKAYLSGSQVNYKGKVYKSNQDTLPEEEPTFSTKWEDFLIAKADLMSNSKNIFNKDTNKINFASGQGTSTGVDSYDSNSILVDALGMGYSQGISMSPAYKISAEKPSLVLSGSSSNSNRVYYYNASGVRITNSADNVRLATYSAGVDHVRFSYPSANQDSIQIEYGITSTSFESYDGTLRIPESQLPKTSVKKSDLDVFVKSESLAVKADLTSQTKNIFNKNATKITFASGQGTSVGADSYDANSILVDALGMGYNQGISMSPAYKISAEKPNLVLSGSISNSNRVYYYNGSGVRITHSADNVRLATYSAGVDHVRFSYPSVNQDTIQIEYGITPTSFESYDGTLRIPESQLPKTSVKKSDLDVFAKSESLASKADLTNQTKNIFNRNTTKITFASGQGTSVGADSYDANSILVDALGMGYNQGISMSPAYKISAEKPNLVLSGSISNSNRVYYYNASGVRITHSADNVRLATYSAGVDHVRFSYPSVNQDTIQIEYGITPTSFESYDSALRVPEVQLPKSAARKEDIASEVEKKVGTSGKIVLPSKIYLLKNAQNNFYLGNFLKFDFDKKDFILTQSNTELTSIYEDRLFGKPVIEKSLSNTFNLYGFENPLDSKTIQIQSVSSPTIGKSLEVWNTGNSLFDLGVTQKKLKDILLSDNISCNFRGLMPVYQDEIYGEVRSGGQTNFLTESGSIAKIITVNNIVAKPETKYPGTKYLDSNGFEWVIRGFKLSQNQDGTYSGKIKLGVFTNDPNYGITPNGGTPSGNFPSTGVLSKSNTKAGDSTISYSASENAYYNPYWNPVTNQLDFVYYQNYWGFQTPDALLMQWGFNDVPDYPAVQKNTQMVLDAVDKIKTFIDLFHVQIPSAKVVLGVDSYGSELPAYTGGKKNSSAKKYNILSFAERVFEVFDNPSYSFVYVVPTYAQVDSLLAYSPVVEQVLCDIYPDKKIKTMGFGYDGIHPFDISLGAGSEFARAYRPLFNLIAS